MSCTLSKYENYDVASVKHDASEGKYVVRLSHPPVTCPDGLLITHKAELVLDGHLNNPVLSYNVGHKRPVILVKDMQQVQEIGPQHNYFVDALWFLAVVMALTGFGYILYLMFRPRSRYVAQPVYVQSQPMRPRIGYTAPYHPAYVQTPMPLAPAPSVNVINNNVGNNNLLETALAVDLLEHHHDRTHEVIIERDHYIDTAEQARVDRDNYWESDKDSSVDSSSDYSSDDSSSSDSYSSDSSGSDSYSSD